MPSSICLIPNIRKTKYNMDGFMDMNVFASLQVSDRYALLLSGAANMAISENTKQQYRTAIKHINRIEEELKIDMSLPFDLGKTLNYVGFLLRDRGCCAKTVGQYLSGIRMLHLCKGLDIASLRPPIVNMILKGREHWDNVNNTLMKKPKRVPVTIKVLKYIKRVFAESSYDKEKKVRLWLIGFLLWNGSL